MQRRNPTFAITLTLLASVVTPSAVAQVSSSGINQWTLAAAMNSPRSQACSAILPDGSLLVSGGLANSGPVNTAEIYGANGKFAVTASMNQARSNAACATLLDGRVLVMGGDDGTGAITSAEIYDPAKQTWTSTGGMNTAREGHQAVVNAWGGVLVAGGTNASGLAATLEEFDPGPGTFRTVGSLTTPRTEFAMVVLPKRQVLIAGGSNGTSTLGSIEIYNGNIGMVSVAGSMVQARQDFAAATLPDGTILITGGRDPNGNLLGSTEIFDPVAGVSTAGPNLMEPRAYHSAYGLTNNGQVVIAGGIGASGVLSSTETYAPWSGGIQRSASFNVNRRDNVSAFVAPGNLLVAGGRNASGSLNSSELFQYVTIGTDQADYLPGTAVKISGSGWQPGEQVTVQIMASPVDQHHIEFTGSGIADGAGNVTVSGFAVDQSHFGKKFILTATGSQLQAQTSFTDGSLIPTITFSYSPASGGSTSGIPVTVTVTFSGSAEVPTGAFVPCVNGLCNVSGATVPGAGNTCTVIGNHNDDYTLPGTTPDSCQFTIPLISPGSTQIGVSYAPASGSSYVGNVYNDPNGSYVVTAPTSITMTSGPTGATPYGSTTPYVATVTAANGTNSLAGKVQFYVSGGAIGANAPYGSPVATVPVSVQTTPPTFTATFVPSPALPVSAIPYLITAQFVGDSANGPSTTANNISTTIQAVNTTVTGAYSANPVVYGQTPAFTISGTVSAVSGGGTPTGTVTVSGIGGAVGCNTITLTNGAYSCSFTAPGPAVAASPYTATVTYTPTNGSGYNASNATVGGNGATLVVTQAATLVSAPVVTASSGGSNLFTLSGTATTIAPSAAAVNAGSIAFYALSGSSQNTANCATGTNLGSYTVNSSGVASTGSIAIPNGNNTICAIYVSTGASSNFATSSPSAGLNLTSPAAAIATTLGTPSGGPATFGAPVTITGTITATSGAAFPTGTLTFFDASNGNAQIGTPATISQGSPANTGTATVTVSNLTGGTHNVYSVFTSNNGAFAPPAPNTSATGAVVINVGTATFAITSSATQGGNVVDSNNVTLTATYNGGNATKPTGTVNFINTLNGNGIVCSSATLTAGVATCTVSATAANNLPASASPGRAANISLSYSGDSNYSSVLGTVTQFGFNVITASTVTNLVLTSNPVTVGGTVTLVATVTTPGTSLTPGGTVTFSSSNGHTPINQSPANCIAASSPTPVALTLSSGNYTATCSFTDAGPGAASPNGTPLSFSATYSGDANTGSSTGNQSLTSIGASTTTTVSAATSGAPITVEANGQTVVLTAVLGGVISGITPTGSFTFSQSGTANTPTNQSPAACIGTPVAVHLSSSLWVATCQFQYAGSSATSVTYTATYGSDTDYLPSSNTLTLTSGSNPTQTALAATIGGFSATTETIGQLVTLTATVTGNPAISGLTPSGTVTFALGGNAVAGTSTCGSAVTVTAGVATCQFEFAGPAGSALNYSATYSGDTIFTGSNKTISLSTSKATPGTPQVSVSPNTVVSGQPFTVSVTVPASGSPTSLPSPTGCVTISTSAFSTQVQLSGGSASLAVGSTVAALTAGSYTITATYSPTCNSIVDANYVSIANSISLTVGKDATTTGVSSSNVGTQVTVSAAAPGTGTPTGTVSIYSGTSTSGTPVASGTLSNGVFIANLVTGTYTAVYSGDTNFLASTSAASSITQARSPATTLTLVSSNYSPGANQQITLSATINGTGPQSPTGTVTFTDNGVVIGTANVLGGQAILNTTLPPGSNSITATYGGDSNYSGSSGTISLQVGKPASTVTVTASSTTSVFGQSVTFTAKIASSGSTAATGTVQFYDGTTLLGSATVVNGVATLTVSNLPAGTNNITVIYSGDSNYGGFSGSAGSIAVGKASILTTATAVTNNGQETVTATVAVVAPGAGTPTGTVQFVDTVTGKVVGTATLAGGTASITIPVTTDPIMAVYSGDSNFSTSTATNISAIAAVNAASYAVNYAPNEIVTVFGSALTTQSLTASLPLPTSLGGVSVAVTDSANVTRNAVLFYVSAGQISFLIPTGTANGTATITVTTATGTFTNIITVTGLAPGLFTANASGIGPLSAQVVAVTPAGAQTYTNTATLSGTTFVNAPIAFTPAADSFYLLLYGTGFDQATASTLTVTINGKTYTPAFVGPQGTYAGLDQINVLLPTSLAGSGSVNVSITVNGQTSNVGTIAFQ